MSSTRVLTLAAGARHVAGAAFTRGRGSELTLEEFASEPFATDPRDQEGWAEECGRALTVLAKRLRRRGPAILAVPGHVAWTKSVKTPAIAAAQRERVARFEAEQNMPCSIEEVAWGWATAGEVEGELHLLLAAARTDLMERLCAAAEGAKLPVIAAVPASAALMRAFSHAHPEITGSVLLASVGARSTHVVLTEAGRYVARTFAFGSDGLTGALAAELGVEFAAAEQIRRAIVGGDNDVSMESGVRTVAARMTEEFAQRARTEVIRTLLALRREFPWAEPTAIFLTGDGLPGARLNSLLEERLRIPARRLDPLRRVAQPESAVASGPAKHGPAMFPAELVGLAMLADSSASGELSLMPSRRNAAQALERRKPVLLAAAMLVAVALLPPIRFHHGAAVAVRAETERVEVRVEQLRARQAQMTENLARMRTLGARCDALQNVAAARTSWTAFLADLQDRLHGVGDVWLERLAVQRDTPEAQGVKPALRLLIAGNLLETEHPGRRAGTEAYGRAKRLLTALANSPFVTSVGEERFDHSRPGRLRFEALLGVNIEAGL